MKARTRDGAEIYYEVYDFTDPWSPAETILLHHGLRGNHRQWYDWIPLLAREYRTIVLSARGRGGSTVPPPGFPWSMEQFAADDVAVLDDAGVERVHFIGTSFGSVVGEQIGATYPNRLRTLTLISAPYRFTHLRHVVDRWLEEMDRLGAIEFLRRDMPNLFPEGTDPAVLEWNAQQMATVPDHVARDMLTYMAGVNMADILTQIAVPTLLLGAAKSDRAPATESAFVQQRIPNARLVTFDSHHNIAVTMRDKCVATVLDFLREHRGNG